MERAEDEGVCESYMRETREKGDVDLDEETPHKHPNKLKKLLETTTKNDGDGDDRKETGAGTRCEMRSGASEVIAG